MTVLKEKKGISKATNSAKLARKKAAKIAFNGPFTESKRPIKIPNAKLTGEAPDLLKILHEPQTQSLSTFDRAADDLDLKNSIENFDNSTASFVEKKALRQKLNRYFKRLNRELMTMIPAQIKQSEEYQAIKFKVKGTHFQGRLKKNITHDICIMEEQFTGFTASLKSSNRSNYPIAEISFTYNNSEQSISLIVITLRNSPATKIIYTGKTPILIKTGRERIVIDKVNSYVMQERKAHRTNEPTADNENNLDLEDDEPEEIPKDPNRICRPPDRERDRIPRNEPNLEELLGGPFRRHSPFL